jgi:quercetin dioxygenase-like cupin family protein
MKLWPSSARTDKTLKAKLLFEEIPSEHKSNCTETKCAAESSRSRGVLKTSIQVSTKSREARNHHEQRITPNGTLFEFLASPDETGSGICLIRGTIPVGAGVPLHSHCDVELFYALQGTFEAFQSSDGTPRWTTVGAGDTVTIPGNTKHPVRNSSTRPATIVVVTTSKLYEFFHEVTRRIDPDQLATPPTPVGIREVLRLGARSRYWMGSPEENAAIGLSLT